METYSQDGIYHKMMKSVKIFKEAIIFIKKKYMRNKNSGKKGHTNVVLVCV